MNRGRGSQAGGYTIVETLIFLAVSGAMFVAAMMFLSGQQAKTEFGQSIRDFESSLQSIANDISNGYYANTTSQGKQFNCSVTGGVVKIGLATGPDVQGTSQDCIFAGKAVQFGPKDVSGMGTGEGYTIFTVAGKRLDGDQPVADYTDAGLTAAYNTSGIDSQDVTVSSPFEYGVTVACVFYANATVSLPTDKPCTDPPAGAVSIDTLSFITTFQGTDVANGTHSGSIQVDMVVPAHPANIGHPRSETVALINTYSAPSNSKKNPAGGVFICLQSGGTKQYGIIHLGGDGSQFATTSTIREGSCT